MTARGRRTLRLTAAGVGALLAGAAIFVGVTAMQGGDVITVPLPSAATVIETLALVAIAEMLRRGLKKLDDVSGKCDGTQKDFGEFRTRVETVLLGADGRGGLVNEVRDLQGAVYHEDPGPVAVPPGFSIAPRAHLGAEP